MSPQYIQVYEQKLSERDSTINSAQTVSRSSRRKRVIFASLFAMTAALGYFIFHTDQNADCLCDDGDLLVQSGQYVQAVSCYTASLQRNHDLLRAYRGRAVAYERIGEVEKAVADYGKIIQLSPLSTDAIFQRGILQQNLGNYAEAIDDYSETIRRVPDHAWALFSRGTVALENREYTLAQKDFEAAIRNRPDFTDAHFCLGVVYESRNEIKTALEYYDQAIELDPNHTKSRLSRGTVYQREGDHDGAIADFDVVLGSQQLSIRGLVFRSVSHTSLGNYDEAIDDLNAAISHAPHYADAYLERGNIQFRKYIFEYTKPGNSAMKRQLFAHALKDYSQAIRLDPGDTIAYTNRAAAYEFIGENAKAEADLAQAEALNQTPTETPVHP